MTKPSPTHRLQSCQIAAREVLSGPRGQFQRGGGKVRQAIKTKANDDPA